MLVVSITSGYKEGERNVIDYLVINWAVYTMFGKKVMYLKVKYLSIWYELVGRKQISELIMPY